MQIIHRIHQRGKIYGTLLQKDNGKFIKGEMNKYFIYRKRRFYFERAFDRNNLFSKSTLQ